MEVVVVLAVFGLFTAVIVRLRRATSTRTPIGALGPGRADVHGRAAGPAELRAPISGRTGIGFRLLIEQEQGVRGWVAVVDHAEFADFELRDRSGVIRVQASTSIIDLDVGERGGMGGPFRPLPASVVQLIATRVPVQGVLFHKGFRWREWVLEPDREVRVRGQVVAIPSEQPIGYRELGHALVLAGGNGRPLEILD
ncbi:GIDE domain-containing protein [Nannocystaceae bacterium ST9]